MEIEETLALHIKKLRNDKNMTQKEFSDFIGIKQQTLSGYERGIMKPSLEIIKEIAIKCEVSIDWLCGLDVKKGELTTYSDVINLLIKFNSITNLGLSFEITEKIDNTFPSIPDKFNVATINIDNLEIIDFFKEWTDILNICKKSHNGENLYKIWMADVLIRYNHEIKLNTHNDILPFS